MATIADILEMEEMANEFSSKEEAQKAVTNYYKLGNLISRIYKKTQLHEFLQNLSPSQEYLKASAGEYYINHKETNKPLEIPYRLMFSNLRFSRDK